VEAVTDPTFEGWYLGSTGGENADLCAWMFGAYPGELYQLSNGTYANMRLGRRDYLLQLNWVNQGAGFCALHL
jgi:hypothetical protein